MKKKKKTPKAELGIKQKQVSVVEIWNLLVV